MDDHLKKELNAAGIRAARDFVADLRTLIWDGTGLTLEEAAEVGIEGLYWRDVGMTMVESVELLAKPFGE